MRTMLRNFAYIVLIASILPSCAPSRFVEPLGEDKQAVGINFGGPLIDFGGTIPIPLSSIVYGRGIDSNLTVFASLHTTSLAFYNLQTDIGASYRLLSQKGYIPAVSASLALNIVYDFNDNNSKTWPELDINAYWNYGKHNNYFYIGMSNWFELAPVRVHGEKQMKRWIFNPHIGHVYKTDNFQYTFEMKFLAPNISHEKAFIPYKSITGNNGATGVYLSVRRTF